MSSRVSIVGDDFTPSSLLASAVRARLAGTGTRLDLICHDLDGAIYHKTSSEGIAEFLGDPRDMMGYIGDAEVLMTTFGPVSRAVLEKTSLDLIVCGRGGPVNVDAAAAEYLGVTVRNCPGRNVDAVAEYVIGLIISVTRQIPQAERWVSDGRWVSGQEDSLEKPTGPELRGRTLGVVGYGAIGRRVTGLGRALGMSVLVHDPFVEAEDAEAISFVDLRTLLKGSDVVTIHARPSGDGTPIVGEQELSSMPSGSYLVNTSRGENLDEVALIEALESGHLAGAALDVLAEEPIDGRSPLLNRSDVLLTPHAAGVSLDIPARTAGMMADHLAEWMDAP